MNIEFEPKKEIRRFENAYGKELIENGMSFYVGDYKWLSAYNDVVNWLSDNQQKGLMCVGDFGLGKSLICEKIIPAMMRSWNWEVFVISAYDMSKRIDEIKKYDIVVIDDFGVEGESVIYGEHRHIFNEIVDWAEKNGVMLILTSNLSLEEMKKKYGVRVVDRLNKITKPVIFSGDSLR